MPHNSTQIANKWIKTNVLRSDSVIENHIPKTVRFSVDHLKATLGQFRMVVLKPVVGTGGSGLMRIEKRVSTSDYSLQIGTKTFYFRHFDALVNTIRRYQRGRSFLIQQGIHLARYQGRPIDYRVKLIKEDDKWMMKAMVGRWARPGLFVTNLCRGGTQLKSAQAIRMSLSPSQVRPKKQQMRALSYRCKNVFTRNFPNVGQLGFDFGIDKNGKIWLLELNTRPH